MFLNFKSEWSNIGLNSRNVFETWHTSVPAPQLRRIVLHRAERMSHGRTSVLHRQVEQIFFIWLRKLNKEERCTKILSMVETCSGFHKEENWPGINEGKDKESDLSAELGINIIVSRPVANPGPMHRVWVLSQCKRILCGNSYIKTFQSYYLEKYLVTLNLIWHKNNFSAFGQFVFMSRCCGGFLQANLRILYHAEHK